MAQDVVAAGDIREAAVGRKRDAAVEEQVAVVDTVERALFVEEVDVAVQAVAFCEGVGDVVDDPPLLGREGIGVGGV